MVKSPWVFCARSGAILSWVFCAYSGAGAVVYCRARHQHHHRAYRFLRQVLRIFARDPRVAVSIGLAAICVIGEPHPAIPQPRGHCTQDGIAGMAHSAEGHQFILCEITFPDF
jgi:hypothetical protein